MMGSIYVYGTPKHSPSNRKFSEILYKSQITKTVLTRYLK